MRSRKSFWTQPRASPHASPPIPVNLQTVVPAGPRGEPQRHRATRDFSPNPSAFCTKHAVRLECLTPPTSKGLSWAFFPIRRTCTAQRVGSGPHTPVDLQPPPEMQSGGHRVKGEKTKSFCRPEGGKGASYVFRCVSCSLRRLSVRGPGGSGRSSLPVREPPVPAAGPADPLWPCPVSQETSSRTPFPRRISTSWPGSCMTGPMTGAPSCWRESIRPAGQVGCVLGPLPGVPWNVVTQVVRAGVGTDLCVRGHCPGCPVRSPILMVREDVALLTAGFTVSGPFSGET